MSAGKDFRTGISLIELFEMFPDEDSARQWFESTRWPTGRVCPRCDSERTREASHAKMPYWCSDCRSYFSVKVGTIMESSKIPLRKWAIAIYQITTSLKGVSSMKLHRDLKISQTSAWFLNHRIREAMDSGDPMFSGPVEADETYFGGKRKNMSADKRAEQTGRGAAGKTPVVGVRDRDTGKVDAEVVERVNKPTVQDFVEDRTDQDAIVYTDEAAVYVGIDRAHEAVRHSVGEYVRGMAHTNGLESFWASMKRGYQGVYHWMSAKHLHRYVSEFEGRHNDRPHDTIDQMRGIVLGGVGKRLKYTDLIA